MALLNAPIQTPVILTDKEVFGYPAQQWVLYFAQLATGDPGTAFVPTYANLTIVGAAPVITAAYFRSGQFVDFEIHIVPGTSTSSTAGSTYFQLPFNVLSDGGCFVETGLQTAGAAVDSATDRVYTPNWSAVTVPITLAGRVRAS